MIRSVEAIIDEAGNVRLLDDVRLAGPRRAMGVTILDEPPITETGTPTGLDQSVETVNHWGTLYESIRMLGRGGIGRDLPGRDRQTGTLVCVKQLLPDVDPASLLQECRALARLDHPNIVRLLNFDTTASPPYLVVEYVGRTHAVGLHAAPPHRRRAGGGPPGDRLFEALAYAHGREILHCDLKPGNILLSGSPGGGPQPRVLDFGLGGRRSSRRPDAVTGKVGSPGRPPTWHPSRSGANAWAGRATSTPQGRCSGRCSRAVRRSRSSGAT